MVIAAYIKKTTGRATDSSSYIHELLKHYAARHPGHRIVIFSDTEFHTSFTEISNIAYIKTAPKSNNRLLQKFWFDLKLPKLLRKNQADIFISTTGVCSAVVKIPQIIVADPDEKIRKQAHRHLEKAAMILAFLNHQKTNISETVPGTGEKIKIVDLVAPGDFHPLQPVQKIAVKNKFTEGKEYFLFAGELCSEKDFINLLKAFSYFKKRQQSSMKLVVLTGSSDQKNITSSIDTYKYRQDVLITGAKEKELAALFAAAYGIIYFSQSQLLPIPVAAAMQAATPVICSDDAVSKELSGDAALYITPADHRDSGEKMMLLYTNESLRSQLIEKGIHLSSRLSLPAAVQRFEEYLHEAIN